MAMPVHLGGLRPPWPMPCARQACEAQALGLRSGFTRVHGQALVLGMALLAMGSLALIWQVRGGLLVESRSELSTVAESVVWAGAAAQTQALNATAWLHRTQVAHQLSIAHLVTLAAWQRYGQTQAQHLAINNPPIHMIALFGPAHAAAYLAAAQAASVLPDQTIPSLLASHEQHIHGLLASSAQAVLSDLPANRLQWQAATLQRNIQEGTGSAWAIDAQALTDDWTGGHAPRWMPASGQSPLRALLDPALEDQPFLQPRDHTAQALVPINPLCPHLRHELRRRGRTERDAQGRWQALDAESWHALRSNRWIGCYFREYPKAHGAVRPDQFQQAGAVEWLESPPRDFADIDFWRWVEQQTNWDIHSAGRGNPLASSWAMADAIRPNGRGLPGGAQPGRVGAGPSSMQSSVLRYALRAGRVAPTGVGSSFFPDSPIQQIAVAAESYFSKPDGAPAHLDTQAHLFYPWWQTRLSVATTAERAAAAARAPLLVRSGVSP